MLLNNSLEKITTVQAINNRILKIDLKSCWHRLQIAKQYKNNTPKMRQYCKYGYTRDGVIVASKAIETMWRILGSQTTRNQKTTQSLIAHSHHYKDKACNYADAQLIAELRKINFFTANHDNQALWCALISEASTRSLAMTPYDEQLQAMIRLLIGDITQMATGEGKTLVGGLAAVGFILSGHTVHIMGANDYLAYRDFQLMKPLYNLIGISSNYIDEAKNFTDRKDAYHSEILYGSVHEFGFDILRENQITDISDSIIDRQDVAIIDEADSVLVDEALTPLVLAGSTQEISLFDKKINDVVASLEQDTDFSIDSFHRTISLLENGTRKIESCLGGISLYSIDHVSSTLVQVNLALQAHFLMQKDVHYIVREGAIKLINSSRGRISDLQRWPDGLQAAVEQKENIAHTDNGTIIDTITVQALIHKYPVVCGMTGTALAAGEQFRQFYNLAISPIPSHKPNIRIDNTDRVYDTKGHKVAAMIKFVQEIHKTGRPILIGTHDVAESEELAELLEDVGLTVNVLNAKNDTQEASIIAEAGKLGAITVSTQMAGRGVDIKLGGAHATAEEFLTIAELGGLLVIGTSRHETARLDDQLRGRAGRQGDPGESIFFSSLEDPIVTRYAPLKKLPNGIDENGFLPKKKGISYLSTAQRISEGLRLEAHASTWRYNQIINKQREIFTQKRYKYLTSNSAWIQLMKEEPERAVELIAMEFDSHVYEDAARQIVLFHLDRNWSQHLEYAQEIQSSIHLRALGNQSPLDEYTQIMLKAFDDLAKNSWSEARGTFRDIKIDASGAHLDSLGLFRSLHTWTYMIHDNPFTSGGSKILSGIVGIFK